jgi:hypothetical protein
MTSEEDNALFDAVVTSGAYRRVTSWVPVDEHMRRRDAGTAAADEHAGDFWRVTCDQAIRHLAAIPGRRWTVEDLRNLGVPEPVSRNAWGARLNAASRAGVIKKVDYWPSRRPEAHGRVLAVWQGAK